MPVCVNSHCFNRQTIQLEVYFHIHFPVAFSFPEFQSFLLFCHEMFELFRRFLVISKSVLIEFTSSTLT